MASITKRGKTYRFRVSAGYDTSGKQIVKTRTWMPPDNMSQKKAEKEARHQAELFEEQIRRGEYTDRQRIKFQTFAEERWFPEYAETQLRPRTRAGYRDLMQRIYPELGHLYLDQIRPSHLANFYRKLSETGKCITCRLRKDLRQQLRERGDSISSFANCAGVSRSALENCCNGKNICRKNAEKITAGLNTTVQKLFEEVHAGETLSSNTVAKYHRALSSILQTAVQWQYITANPCDRVSPPRAKRTEPRYLTREEAVRLLELTKELPIYYRTVVVFLLYTGCRRGEALGLTWQDVNFRKRTIDISRTTQYLPGRGNYTDETKNRSSNRVIAVPETVVQALRDYQLWQKEQHLKLGRYWKNREEKVFVRDDGAPIQPDTLSCWFSDCVKQTDLPSISLHSLRHTCATLNITNGAALNTVAGQLGHASTETTTRIYTHTIQSAQAEAVDRLDDLLNPSRRKKAK